MSQPIKMATPPGQRPKQRPQKNGNAKARPRERFSLKNASPLVLGLSAFFIVLAIAAGVLAFNFVKGLVLSWTSTQLPGVAIESNGPTEEGYIPDGEEYEVPLQEADDLQAAEWDGASRVNMLVMGLDYRDWEENDIPRTDSMIVVTLDPVTLTAGMLSIPRDMWVEIPGFDYGKINTAYFLGEGNKLPGGGPALAVKTVEQFLGVPIHFYAQIDFNAFVDFIDEIGGVDIHVKEDMTIDPLGQGNTIFLKPGVQTFDGATTLAYARARYSEGGDFDRAQRQQQVIMAVLDNILNYYSLPKLVADSPQMYKTLSSGIKTNMNLQQAISLAWMVSKIPDPAGSIKRATISEDVVTMTMSFDGQSILIPIPDEVRMIRDSIFAGEGTISPVAATLVPDEAALIQQEMARISVQNGTSEGGLASQTAQYFTAQGMQIVEETNADAIRSVSELIVYNGKPYTIQYLSDLLGISSSRIYNQYNPDATYDIAVILGQDWASANPMQ
jgi:LCP family protein required for cell wall assembly